MRHTHSVTGSAPAQVRLAALCHMQSNLLVGSSTVASVCVCVSQAGERQVLHAVRLVRRLKQCNLCLLCVSQAGGTSLGFMQSDLLVG